MFVLTCSKISANMLINFTRSGELHLMFSHGSSEIACSTNSCGRICANECRAVTHPTNRGVFDFSNAIIDSTRPLTICWQARINVSGISFFNFESSLLSFGSKT